MAGYKGKSLGNRNRSNAASNVGRFPQRGSGRFKVRTNRPKGGNGRKKAASGQKKATR